MCRMNACTCVTWDHQDLASLALVTSALVSLSVCPCVSATPPLEACCCLGLELRMDLGWPL